MGPYATVSVNALGGGLGQGLVTYPGNKGDGFQLERGKTYFWSKNGMTFFPLE